MAAGPLVPPTCSAHLRPVINLKLSPGPAEINRLILARLESGLTAIAGAIFRRAESISNWEFSEVPTVPKVSRSRIGPGYTAVAWSG